MKETIKVAFKAIFKSSKYHTNYCLKGHENENQEKFIPHSKQIRRKEPKIIKIGDWKINIKVDQRSRWRNCPTLKLLSFSKRKGRVNVKKHFKLFWSFNHPKYGNVNTSCWDLIVIKTSRKGVRRSSRTSFPAFHHWNRWIIRWLTRSFFWS